jgi:heterogeneous nuclear ribonucleoprotein L
VLRRVLLDEKPDPPAMQLQRMPLFDTPGHGGGGAGYPSLQSGGGFSQSSMMGGGGGFSQPSMGGGGFSQPSMGAGYGSSGTGSGWGGGAAGGGGGRMAPEGGRGYQGMWGGGYNNAQASVTPAAMSSAGGGIGGVVMFYQLDPERFNCAGLFNLVCQYGNVSKVCFLKNKEGCAMVEMGDAASADRVLSNLNHSVIFDAKVTIERSRKPYIEDIRKPHQLADGSESYCNYTASRQNRFATPERAAKNRFIPPTKVLHFYNVPKMTDDELTSLFTEVGAAYPARIKWFEPKSSGSKSVTGLVEFETVSEACEALVLVNHAKVNKGSSEQAGHYEMKLCFSKASNIGE